jgi:uncharacterized membrane protein
MEQSGFNINDWLNLLFRWTHVVAGITWIGHLYFFNFVNGQVAKTYDADSKKKVVPELMPRALYWFRWGAMYTWVTGIFLLAFVYYMGGALNTSAKDATNPNASPLGVGAGAAVSMVVLLAAFFIYDALWKALAKKENVGVAVSAVLSIAMGLVFGRLYSGRAALLHMGAMFGTIMFLNVWMRIWPGQRKIIAAIKDGTAPDAGVVALAGLRSKHNTYMSVPLVFFMVSNHYDNVFRFMGADKPLTGDFSWLIVGVFVLGGWGVTKLLYNKSAAAAPKSF